MELLLIRHALPVRREITGGPAELAPAGHAQAEHMANYLSTERIDAVDTSPNLASGLDGLDDQREFGRRAMAALGSGVRSVVTVNETAHLRNTGLPMGLFQKG